jgi:hypothetical protein
MEIDRGAFGLRGLEVFSQLQPGLMLPHHVCNYSVPAGTMQTDGGRNIQVTLQVPRRHLDTSMRFHSARINSINQVGSDIHETYKCA